MIERSPRSPSTAVLAVTLVLALSAGAAPAPRAATPPRPAGGPPTGAEAKTFIEAAEQRLLDLGIKSERSDWVQQNFITQDTEQMAAEATKNLIAAVADEAIRSRRYDTVKLSSELRRKFDLLRLAVELPAPATPAEQTEMTDIVAWLESTYGKGKYCPP